MKLFHYSLLILTVALFGGGVVSAATVPNEIVDPSIPPTIYIHPDAERAARCTTNCNFVSYRLVRQLNCGAVVAIEDALTNKPTCKLVPRVVHSGAVELRWHTTRAIEAFITQGVGHVSTPSGSRIITPTESTNYSMTVVSEDGLIGVCTAHITITESDKPMFGQETVQIDASIDHEVSVPGNPDDGDALSGPGNSFKWFTILLVLGMFIVAVTIIAFIIRLFRR